MTTKILALLVMLLLSASLAGAAVCEDETDATGGYTVTPAKDANGDAGILWIYDTITQGETNWEAVTPYGVTGDSANDSMQNSGDCL